MEYTNNYRHNLTCFWRQFYSRWTIPIGYHVHHIKPKCTFANKNDPGIHHPRNLIALHPDDHVSIHSCRGDVLTKNFITSTVGRIASEEEKNKHRGKNNGMYKKSHTAESCRLISENRKGKCVGNDNPAKRPTVRKILSEGKMGDKNPMYNKSPSIDTRIKMSEAHIRNRNGMYDKTHTAESIQKMKDNCKKISVTINGIFYKSKREACNSLSITYYELSKILKIK